MKFVTVTDAWEPQVNGVVRTIQATNRELERAGHKVAVISPLSFFTLPCPGYADIRLSLFPRRRLARLLRAEIEVEDEVAVHIATEGPLGSAARRFCRRRGIPFSTAYHTRFPQYLRALFGVPEGWTYAFLRRFHGAADVVMAPTATVEDELREARIGRIARWTRGVDTEIFQPSEPAQLDRGAPIFLYVGRVSVEKNIEAFLRLDLPGTKVVAGIGPALELMQRRHPEVHFLGVLTSAQLARLYSAASVFVFPSRTDTFGLVMLEALACGTPVAAYPVQGPLDVVGGSDVAVLDDDLQRAALAALRIDRRRCREFAVRHSWAACTQEFISLQIPWRSAVPKRDAAPAENSAAPTGRAASAHTQLSPPPERRAATDTLPAPGRTAS
ncbi:MAG TPA: glycosyltransferase family 1 protein [Burkholderiaceae bacterium]|nr:glycosyltransferase family 1 protein [Burkholderiaceae bacterium]